MDPDDVLPDDSYDDEKQSALLDDRRANQQPGHVCTYIYTSGTTGAPKAVMITHDNIIFEATNACNNIPQISPDGERIISYLPLSHVAGMMVDIVCPILTKNSTTVCFARPYDIKFSTISARIQAVKPTMFLGVPRVWEKIQEGIEKKVAENPTTGIKKFVADQGKECNLYYARNHQMGASGETWFFQSIGNYVGDTVKGILGLDKCNFAFTGAAPIKVETLEFFGKLGININEVYGMSECTGATTWSTDEFHKWGYCGWPMDGQEVRVMEVGTSNPVPTGQDGEICYRGRHIMLGYMANPDLGPEHVEEIKKKNNEAIDGEGWLHSGDKGQMIADGLVRITGRFKELIIGAGGENVAPVPVEDGIKSRCKAISNVMMVGDKRKFNVALITLKVNGATGDLPGGYGAEGILAAVCQNIDPDSVTLEDAMKPDSKMVAAVLQAITETNADTSCCPMPPSKIGRFAILPQDFSVLGEDITPTFKLKRQVVDHKYTKFIDSMYEYAGKDAYIPYENLDGVEPVA